MMGMFDYIVGVPDILCACGAKLGSWQSKYGLCQCASVHFTRVNNFYTFCGACGAWHEYSRPGDGVPVDLAMPVDGTLAWSKVPLSLLHHVHSTCLHHPSDHRRLLLTHIRNRRLAMVQRKEHMRLDLNLDDMCEIIGYDCPEDWEGHCHEVAGAMVEHKLVQGEAVYGHYRGPVAPESKWADRAERLGFVRHGWIVTNDGKIVDPTRWAFENTAPYIYECDSSSDDYDEGGNVYREKSIMPPPDVGGKKTKLHTHLSEDACNHVEDLLMTSPPVTDSQLFWLANLPYDMLQPFIDEIYKVIVKMGNSAFIPIDNRRRMEREQKLAANKK